MPDTHTHSHHPANNDLKIIFCSIYITEMAHDGTLGNLQSELQKMAAQVNALLRFKEAQKRYRQSVKGREAIKRAQQKYTQKKRSGRPVGRPRKDSS